jgi:pSer/pThr/pTyr-binding forkhead associated (FHA) protein
MNGTLLNGQRVGRARLQAGDELRLGLQRVVLD